MDHPDAFDEAGRSRSERLSAQTPAAAGHLRLVEAQAREPSRPESPFDELYRLYFHDVYRNLALLGVPLSARDDSAQEVFMVVHRRLNDFEGRSTARTWILGIARRIAWRERRGSLRRRRRREALSREPEFTEGSLDDVIENLEAAEILEAFLETLERPQREAFVLGAVQGIGRIEMGEILGVSPNTAYSRLRAARAKFKIAAIDPVGQERLLREWRARRGLGRAPVATRAWVPLWFGEAGRTVAAWSWGAKLGTGALVAGFAGLATLFAAPAPARAPEPARAPAADAAGAQHVVATPRGSRGAPASLPARGITSKAPAAPADLFWVGDDSSGQTVVQRRPERTSRVDTSTQDSLAVELSILRDAQAASLNGDWPRAEAALQAHRRAFPNGHLSIDRDYLLAAYACEQGDPIASVTAFNRFASRYPASPQSSRLKGLCGLPSRQ